MNVELVVFDLCGTTVRDHDAASRHLRATMIAAGTEVTREEMVAVMGLPREVAIRELLTLRRGRVPEREVVAALHEDFVDRVVRYYRDAPEVGEVPGAASLFRELRRRGVRVALETGFRRRVMSVLLDRLAWRCGEHFDTAVASDEAPRGRPSPDTLLAAMRRTGVTRPARVAKVGDTPADMQAATAAGCGLIIGVASEAIPSEEMTVYSQVQMVESLAEAMPLLESPVTPLVPSPRTVDTVPWGWEAPLLAGCV